MMIKKFYEIPGLKSWATSVKPHKGVSKRFFHNKKSLKTPLQGCYESISKIKFLYRFLAQDFNPGIVFLFLIFSISSISAKSIENIDYERLKTKIDNYQSQVNKAKNFRKTVYATTIVSAVLLTTYIGYKVFNKDSVKKDENQDKQTLKNSSIFNGMFLHKYAIPDNLKDACKFGFLRGLDDGVKLAAMSLITIPTIAFGKNVYGKMSDKFMDLWEEKNDKYFKNNLKELDLLLDQIEYFFVENNFDKEEINYIYNVFIDITENLIALVHSQFKNKKEINFDLLGYTELVINSINNFSKDLETEVNKLENFNKLPENLKKSFNVSIEQLKRFINLSISAFYEN